MAVAVQDIGSRTVRLLDGDVEGAVHGVKTFSVIGVEPRDTWPVIVNKLKILATTVTGVVTFLGTARSPRRNESRPATAVARPATWLGTVTTRSRNATPAVVSVTSRNFVLR